MFRGWDRRGITVWFHVNYVCFKIRKLGSIFFSFTQENVFYLQRFAHLLSGLE